MDGFFFGEVELGFASLKHGLAVLFDEVVEFSVVSFDEEEWVSERVEEDLFEWLQEVDADGGEELEENPFVEHDVARLRNFRRHSGIRANKAFS